MNKSIVENKRLKDATVWIAVFLCVFIPFRNVLELYTTSLIKILPDLLILGLLAWYVIASRFHIGFLAHDYIIIGFIGIAFISTIFINKVGIMPFVFQVRSMGLYYIFYFVVRRIKFERQEIRKIVIALQLVSIVLFIFGVIEKIGLKTILFPQSVADSIIYASNFARVYSLFFNPNTFAMFCVFTLLICLVGQMVYSIRTSPVIYGLLLASLFLSMSRAGILAFAGAVSLIGAYLLIKYRKRVFTLKRVTSIVIIITIGITGYFIPKYGSVLYNKLLETSGNSVNHINKIQDSINIGASDRFSHSLTEKELTSSSNDGRIYSLKQGVKVFLDNPIWGTGFGTFGSSASLNFRPSIVDKYQLPFPFYSDMQYITILVETGAVGFLLFASFLCLILLYYRKNFLKLVFCIVFGWFGLFSNIFEMQIASLLFWLFIGIDFSIDRRNEV